MKGITIRLRQGEDLKKAVMVLTEQHGIKAGCILSVVGSLKNLRLRLADGKTVRGWTGRFEIVSGTGTLSPDGCHIHLSVADEEGRVIGGHLQEGCVVNTTVELVVGVFPETEYRRAADEETGYRELETSDICFMAAKRSLK